MGFLRRFLGGARGADDPAGAANDAGRATGEADAAPADPADDPAERAYELELLREEGARLSELVRRQLRYADHAWQPPAQGGERRADDPSADAEGAKDVD
jgi:hypothetical protein